MKKRTAYLPKTLWYSSIILLLPVWVVFQACRRQEALHKAKIIDPLAAKAWLHENGRAYKNETIRILAADRQTLTGTLNWEKAIQYPWQGQDYLDVPFEFNGRAFIPANGTLAPDYYMKKIFLFGFIIIVFCCKATAQSEARIKLQQQWISAHRSFFVGKPFSQLYDSIGIKPKSVRGLGGHTNRFVEFSHVFFYADTANYDDNNYYFLIEWQQPIPLSETLQRGLRAFNAQEYPIYANKIIKSIEVFIPGLL